MRHLEKENSALISSPRPDYLADLIEIKDEIPNLILDVCPSMEKNEFPSDDDDDDNIGDLKIDLNNDSDSSEDFDIGPSKNSSDVRRNRRKALVPQRAVQSELSQGSSLGNSSESSQDLTGSLNFKFIPNLVQEGAAGSVSPLNLLPQDDEYGFELQDDDDDEGLLCNIKEEDIFKDLQEGADGEKFDEEMLDNVKEEWRAHWGVKCNMCKQVFPYRAEFDKHYIDSYGLAPVYTCTFCDRSVEKYSTFRSHCYRHIAEGRYKCQDCPKGFSLQSLLHLHVTAKHTKSKPHTCEECGKTFVTKTSLRGHLKKHKTETKEDYPCVECGKILHTRGGLTSHMNVHRLGRRFMCDVCGKTFTQKVNMLQHVKQHTGDKPHACEHCGKSFAERSHLARHHSFHSSERPFKCNVCQKMYKTERCLKVHSLIHAAARPFVCSVCKKDFLSSTKLKQHSNIHTGERPYSCKYCERTFTNYPNLLKHTRRRHKVNHMTGEHIPPKSEPLPTPTKDELPATPSPGAALPTTTTTTAEVTFVAQPEPQQPSPTQSETMSEQLVADFNLSRTEELLIQQGLLNFPLTDDRFIMPQVDFLTGPSNVGILVPFFPNTLPPPLATQTFITTETFIPTTIQLSDLVSNAPFSQQPLL